MHCYQFYIHHSRNHGENHVSRTHRFFVEKRCAEKNVDCYLKGRHKPHVFNAIKNRTLKNAAHVLSLISNYYSADMQNISLDEAET